LRLSNWLWIRASSYPELRIQAWKGEIRVTLPHDSAAHIQTLRHEACCLPLAAAGMSDVVRWRDRLCLVSSDFGDPS
jgi:hypothetical protein